MSTHEVPTFAISGGQGGGRAAEDDVDGADEPSEAAEDAAGAADGAVAIVDADAEALADEGVAGSDAEANVPTDGGASWRSLGWQDMSNDEAVANRDQERACIEAPRWAIAVRLAAAGVHRN